MQRDIVAHVTTCCVCHMSHVKLRCGTRRPQRKEQGHAGASLGCLKCRVRVSAAAADDVSMVAAQF